MPSEYICGNGTTLHQGLPAFRAPALSLDYTAVSGMMGILSHNGQIANQVLFKHTCAVESVS